MYCSEVVGVGHSPNLTPVPLAELAVSNDELCDVSVELPPAWYDVGGRIGDSAQETDLARDGGVKEEASKRESGIRLVSER